MLVISAAGRFNSLRSDALRKTIPFFSAFSMVAALPSDTPLSVSAFLTASIRSRLLMFSMSAP